MLTLMLERESDIYRKNIQFEVKVADLKEAVEKFIRHRDDQNWAANDYQFKETGNVIFEDGKTFQISYNGRIWSGPYGDKDTVEIKLENKMLTEEDVKKELLEYRKNRIIGMDYNTYSVNQCYNKHQAHIKMDILGEEVTNSNFFVEIDPDSSVDHSDIWGEGMMLASYILSEYSKSNIPHYDDDSFEPGGFELDGDIILYKEVKVGRVHVLPTDDVIKIDNEKILLTNTETHEVQYGQRFSTSKDVEPYFIYAGTTEWINSYEYIAKDSPFYKRLYRQIKINDFNSGIVIWVEDLDVLTVSVSRYKRA